MTTFYIILVGMLLMLAVFDLFVGDFFRYWNPQWSELHGARQGRAGRKVKYKVNFVSFYYILLEKCLVLEHEKAFRIFF